MHILLVIAGFYGNLNNLFLIKEKRVYIGDLFFILIRFVTELIEVIIF